MIHETIPLRDLISVIYPTPQAKKEKLLVCIRDRKMFTISRCYTRDEQDKSQLDCNTTSKSSHRLIFTPFVPEAKLRARLINILLLVKRPLKKEKIFIEKNHVPLATDPTRI